VSVEGAKLFDLIEAGRVEEVRAALARAPDLAKSTDAMGRNALMVAMASPERSLAMIDALLAAGVRADWIDPSGMSVLHWATDINAMGEDLGPLALRLVAAGAPLEHRGPFGWTPLARAVLSGTAPEVAALVAAGARVDVLLPDDTMPPFARGRALVDVASGDERKRAALQTRSAEDRASKPGRRRGRRR
jgi:ankyrin repeat protein